MENTKPYPNTQVFPNPTPNLTTVFPGPSSVLLTSLPVQAPLLPQNGTLFPQKYATHFFLLGGLVPFTLYPAPQKPYRSEPHSSFITQLNCNPWKPSPLADRVSLFLRKCSVVYPTVPSPPALLYPLLRWHSSGQGLCHLTCPHTLSS